MGKKGGSSAGGRVKKETKGGAGKPAGKPPPRGLVERAPVKKGGKAAHGTPSKQIKPNKSAATRTRTDGDAIAQLDKTQAEYSAKIAKRLEQAKKLERQLKIKEPRLIRKKGDLTRDEYFYDYDNGTYNVDFIVASKTTYLVKWTGYEIDPLTWEDEDALDNTTLVRDFERHCRRGFYERQKMGNSVVRVATAVPPAYASDDESEVSEDEWAANEDAQDGPAEEDGGDEEGGTPGSRLTEGAGTSSPAHSTQEEEQDEEEDDSQADGTPRKRRLTPLDDFGLGAKKRRGAGSPGGVARRLSGRGKQ
ncbi:unnamed protein product [Pedinophyceae sp. YPF-701]|nr:unnamed protein product [Pedinophyceae sp. YPF-701]